MAVNLQKSPVAAAVASVTAAGNAAIATIAKTAAKGKPENYTAEESASLVKAYNGGAGVSVDELAVQFGKTKRSIVAKLSREGVYQKQTYVTKNGDAPVSKDALVLAIAQTMGVDESKLGGLEKANKGTIQLIAQVVGDYADVVGANDSEETRQSKQQSILIIANCLNIPLDKVASLKMVDRDTLQFVATAFGPGFGDDEARDDATVEAHEKAFAA